MKRKLPEQRKYTWEVVLEIETYYENPPVGPYSYSFSREHVKSIRLTGWYVK